MTEKKKNLSSQTSFNIKQASLFRIGMLVSEWNNEITDRLLEGAKTALLDSGIVASNIFTKSVPGSFELPTAAVMMLEADDKLDAVICIGCVIQGETRHFDFISQAVANGIMQVGIDYNTPVIFGVLTCDTMEQAIDRAGGKHGNKGVEAAISCLKMLDLERSLH
ncbi:6,7-dimethyl-8-ribityllumazine synthase [Bacteroidales bacterium OttesenSCG-928-C03]|nr:6,7-dimethyl-8-ribityllumazine synthase [Bacteroidales bacterium OttesenSCG-928-C03]MDL2325941.1 6,7-dimethyl-8-ribityllumazine synthase [Bacteroidales bacterium OttesenSCG-928-A14]